MKRIPYTLILATLLFISCNNDPRTKIPQTGTFGESITASPFLTAEEIALFPDSSDGKQVQVQGVVANYCKGEGCWLTLKNKNGKDIFVEIENKAFVLPLNIDGKTAQITGTIAHNAEDSGAVSLLARGITLK